MQALFVAWYNFARKNEALKGATPAMASNLTDHVWTIKELIRARPARGDVQTSDASSLLRVRRNLSVWRAAPPFVSLRSRRGMA